jgi:hypothetical protein
MNLTQCPYDGAQLDIEVTAGGYLLFVCSVCDAAWETHGGWVGRVRGPDRAKVIAARRNATPAPSANRYQPMPMVYESSRPVATPESSAG